MPIISDSSHFINLCHLYNLPNNIGSELEKAECVSMKRELSQSSATETRGREKSPQFTKRKTSIYIDRHVKTKTSITLIDKDIHYKDRHVEKRHTYT